MLILFVFDILTDTLRAGTHEVMTGYLLSVMSPSDLVGFGMHQKLRSQH